MFGNRHILRINRLNEYFKRYVVCFHIHAKTFLFIGEVLQCQGLQSVLNHAIANK